MATGWLSLTAHAADKAQVLRADPGYSSSALAPGVSVEVNVLVTVNAPELPNQQKRPPVAVSLVIDRSGSMNEAKKMAYAKVAGTTLVNSLNADDLFALTTYDSVVELLSPLGPVTDKEKLRKMITAITPRGMTFLSGGLEKGIEQLRSIRKEGPCRVIVLSDGLANQGVTDVEMVAAIGAASRAQGVSVTTVGLGLDFNEDLMQHLAQRGGGRYYYIKDSEDLPAVFREELALVVASFTKNLQASYVADSRVQKVKVYGYSSKAKGKETDIEISDFAGGEKRQIMLGLTVTPDTKPGKQSLGELKLRYTDPADGSSRDVTVPVAIDVIADEAERKAVEDKNLQTTTPVREEALLLEAEEAHVQAIDELRKGNKDGARKILNTQSTKLAQAAPTNKAAAGKMAKLQEDEKNLDQAAANIAMQNEMSKSSKSSAYMSAKGEKQGYMLQRGNSGYMIEKLQNALKTQGYYTKDVDGVYSQDVEDAIKAFQKAKSLPVDGVAGPATLRALGM